MSATIRPLEAQDETAWRGLWRAYLDFYGIELPRTVYIETFRRLLSPAEPIWGLFAEREGRPVGLVHWIRHRHGWRTSDVAYLQDLFVAPEARGAGAGRALIEAVYAAADAQGLAFVYWMTQEGNPARALYDRVATRTDFIKYQRTP